MARLHLALFLLAPWVGAAGVLACADEIDGRFDCPAECLRSVRSEVGPLDCEKFSRNERRAIAELVASGVVDAGDACSPFADIDYVVVDQVDDAGSNGDYVMGRLQVQRDDQARAHEMIHHLERMRGIRTTEHEGWAAAHHWTTAARYEGQAYRIGVTGSSGGEP